MKVFLLLKFSCSKVMKTQFSARARASKFVIKSDDVMICPLIFMQNFDEFLTGLKSNLDSGVRWRLKRAAASQPRAV